MKDFNKDKFNDSIRRKFDHAEVQPGNNVWTAQPRHNAHGARVITHTETHWLF